MYEVENSQPTAFEAPLPREIWDAFGSVTCTISGRTVLPWGEHCTECAMPACYRTCDLYSPRKDGKCRRFAEGMIRIDHPESLYGYILKIDFKPWATLWTVGNTRIFSLMEAKKLEEDDRAIGERVVKISNVRQQIFEIQQHDAGKKRWALQQRPSAGHLADYFLPDYFLIECFNPANIPASALLAIRSLEPPRGVGFQRSLEVLPGFNSFKLPIGEITSVLNMAEPFAIEIIPNAGEGLVLYFGAMDFVQDPAAVLPAPLCKVVAWDLDGTLWEGTLAEDGLDNLILKPGIQEVLAELDRRGVLLSIASKNSAEDAREALKRFGLEEYFLYPQISWVPKAAALRRIAAALNIGLDSVAFVDDSPFERASVRNSCPEVRVFEAADYARLLDRPELRPVQAKPGVSRRDLYAVEQLREASLAAYDGTYLDFLRDCRVEIHIAGLSSRNVTRVHELTQRTNQMNFSGNRYTRPQLDAILAEPLWDTYVIDCRDRFGTYGTIGFCLVDRAASLVNDLMFSCRVQSKQVEHAFLIFLLRKYRANGAHDVYVNYKPAARNANVAKVFDDLGFDRICERNGVWSLVFPFGRDIPAHNTVTIRTTSQDEVP